MIMWNSLLHWQYEFTDPRPASIRWNNDPLTSQWKCSWVMRTLKYQGEHNRQVLLNFNNILQFYPRDAMLAQNLPSSCVCPSVSPSVTSWCPTKITKLRIIQPTPYDSPVTLVFWRQQSLVCEAPFPLKFAWCVTPLRTQRFRPMSARSASTVRASEKCSISTNRKSTTRFWTSRIRTMQVTLKWG